MWAVIDITILGGCIPRKIFQEKTLDLHLNSKKGKLLFIDILAVKFDLKVVNYILFVQLPQRLVNWKLILLLPLYYSTTTIFFYHGIALFQYYTATYYSYNDTTKNPGFLIKKSLLFLFSLSLSVQSQWQKNLSFSSFPSSILSLFFFSSQNQSVTFSSKQSAS